MRRTVKAAAWAAALALVLGASWWNTRARQATRPQVLRIEQVRALLELVSLRIDVADVQETTIRGYLGGRRVLLMVKGDLLISVDLARARFESIDQEQRQVVLVLPEPQTLSARLDHQKTRIVDVAGQGLWLIVPGDAGRTQSINQAYGQAQAYITKAGEDAVLRQRARVQAEQVIGSVLGALGWEVQIRWAG